MPLELYRQMCDISTQFAYLNSTIVLQISLTTDAQNTLSTEMSHNHRQVPEGQGNECVKRYWVCHRCVGILQVRYAKRDEGCRILFKAVILEIYM